MDSEQAEDALLDEIKKYAGENSGEHSEFVLWSAVAGDSRWKVNSHAKQLAPKLGRLAKMAGGWWVRQRVFLSTQDWLARYESTPVPTGK